MPMKTLLIALLCAVPLASHAQSTGSITEDMDHGGFTLAPNPARAQVTVLPATPDVHLFVLFYDDAGHNVLSCETRGTTVIDVDGLPDGAYMVSTVNERGTPLDVHRLLIER